MQFSSVKHQRCAQKCLYRLLQTCFEVLLLFDTPISSSFQHSLDGFHWQIFLDKIANSISSSFTFSKLFILFFCQSHKHFERNKQESWAQVSVTGAWLYLFGLFNPFIDIHSHITFYCVDLSAVCSFSLFLYWWRSVHWQYSLSSFSFTDNS